MFHSNNTLFCNSFEYYQICKGIWALDPPGLEQEEGENENHRQAETIQQLKLNFLSGLIATGNWGGKTITFSGTYKGTATSDESEEGSHKCPQILKGRVSGAYVSISEEYALLGTISRKQKIWWQHFGKRDQGAVHMESRPLPVMHDFDYDTLVLYFYYSI